MYKECVITEKKRAMLNADNGHLFWRDLDGVVRLADRAKVKSGWGIFEYFTCTHEKPRGFQSA